MEVLVVVIILGVIAAFALPNYAKSVRQSHERDMVNQLRVIYAADLMYRAQADLYLIGANLDTNAINNQLDLSIMSSDGTTYDYTSADGNTFQVDSIWSDMTVRVTQAPLSWNNPCCSSLNCPALPGC